MSRQGSERKNGGYSRQVMDHGARPRNTGSLDVQDPRVGTGRAGTAEEGDLVRIQVRVSEAMVIEEARFKAFGCLSSIASSSVVTEKARGRTVQEALRIRSTEIVDALRLPPSKIHCSVLAEDALRAAIRDVLNRVGARNEGNGDESTGRSIAPSNRTRSA